MKFELGDTKSSQFTKTPKFLLSVSRPRPGDHPFRKIGRLYRGYVGLYIIGRLATVNVWIYNLEK